MTQPPPIPYATPITPDAEHLRLLSLFHYISAGLLALFGCFPIVYIIMGILIVRGAFPAPNNQPPMPNGIGYIFITMGAVAILVSWCLALALFFSGRFIAQRRRYIFSMVIAGISCLFMPFGTILGVFTLIVLNRPSVKAIYTDHAAAS